MEKITEESENVNLNDFSNENLENSKISSKSEKILKSHDLKNSELLEEILAKNLQIQQLNNKILEYEEEKKLFNRKFHMIAEKNLELETNFLRNSLLN